MTTHLPNHLIPGGSSPVFTHDTLPEALQAEHTLAPGHWAVLNVLEGSLCFVNLETGEEQSIAAPAQFTIQPGVPHKVTVEGALSCRIDFFREPPADNADNEDSTIGDIIDTAAGIGKRGVRTVQAGAGAVAKATGRIPRVVRKVARKDEGETEATPQEVIVEGLPDDLMKCYLSVLVWLVHTDDKQIDERELCEIQLLMTQRQCNADVRKAVREDLENPHSVDARTRVDHMLRHGPEAGTDTQLALKCALMSDAIRVVRATSEGPGREQPGIGLLADMLELDDKKVRFLEDACVQDEKILGGVLGLSAMVSGIGVVVIAGGITYKGVRLVLGGSQRNRRSFCPRIARPRSSADSPRTSVRPRGITGTTASSRWR